jgi:hypothetical protein
VALEWIIGLAGFALIVWFMVKNRVFRYVVLGIVAVLSLGGWVWYEQDQEEERRLSTLIRPHDIEVRDARLGTSGDYRTLTATIKNNSVYQLSSISITVTVFDCPVGQPSGPQCETVGEGTVWSGVSIPAGQIRAVETSVGLRNMPPLRGEMRWRYEIASLRAARR